jgi:hypothetical protein
MVRPMDVCGGEKITALEMEVEIFQNLCLYVSYTKW